MPGWRFCYKFKIFIIYPDLGSCFMTSAVLCKVSSLNEQVWYVQSVFVQLTNFFGQMRLQLYPVLQMFNSFSHSPFVQTKLSPYFLQNLLIRRFYHFLRHSYLETREMCCSMLYMVFRYISLHYCAVSILTHQFHAYLTSTKHHRLLYTPPPLLPLCGICTQDTLICTEDTLICTQDTLICTQDTLICTQDTLICIQDTLITVNLKPPN